jgi:hypothetical protein
MQLTLSRAKFCLYHRQLIDIQRTNDILPESQKHEYEYSPMPADTELLPISPNLMMYFFLHLDEAASRSVLLQSIPKQKKDKLELCPVADSSLG